MYKIQLSIVISVNNNFYFPSNISKTFMFSSNENKIK